MRQISRSVAGNVARWFSIDSESGVTAIEYGLLASLVALAIMPDAARYKPEYAVQLHRRQGGCAVFGLS